MKKKEIKRFVPDLPIFSPLRLTKYRTRLGMNQIQAAELCRVPVRTWRAWESGQNPMPQVAWAYFLVQFKMVKECWEKEKPYLKGVL